MRILVYARAFETPRLVRGLQRDVCVTKQDDAILVSHR